MTTASGDLKKEARSIATGKGARDAWSELKGWASGRGPHAMKIAMIEFMGVHGRSPESALLMPELLKTAFFAFSPLERRSLLDPSSRKSALDERTALIKPKTLMLMEGARPAISASFAPNQNISPKLAMVEPISPLYDRAYMRDMPIRMRESLQPSLGRPFFSKEKQNSRFDPSRSPNSFSMKPQKGEQIVRSLVDQMRGHGRGENAYLSPVSAPRKTVSKARRVKAKSARAQKRKAPLKKAKAKIRAKAKPSIKSKAKARRK